MADQKTVFITGASLGIGYALAQEFIDRGYKVFAGARSVELMKPLEAQGATVFPFDITRDKDIETAKKLIEEEAAGRLDILYNNAGVPGTGAIFDLSKEDIQRVYDVNVFGPAALIKSFKDLLISNKSTVAFTSSVAPKYPTPFRFPYSSSKGAFDHLAKVLSLETREFGIKVVNVVTGLVESNIYSHKYATPGDSVYYLGEDEEIVQEIASMKKTPTKEYVKHVVDKIEHVIKKQISYLEIKVGGGAFLITVITTFFSFWFYSSVYLRVTKLTDLFKRVAGNWAESKKNI